MAKKTQAILGLLSMVLVACQSDKVDAMIVRHIAPNNGPGQTSPGYTELVDDHGHVFQLRQCFGEAGDIIKVRCEE